MKRPEDDRTLTPEQFTVALDALGWKQADFARRTGLTVQAVSKWATGQVTPPLWAGEYLGLLQDLQSLHTKYLAPLRIKTPGRLAHLLPATDDSSRP